MIAEPRVIFGKNINAENHPEWYKKVSPLYQHPISLPPMFFSLGSRDNLTTPELVKAYVDQLRAARHENIQYWVHEGRPHAFLDSGSNPYLGIEFEKDAPPALDRMLQFLDEIFY